MPNSAEEHLLGSILKRIDSNRKVPKESRQYVRKYLDWLRAQGVVARTQERHIYYLEKFLLCLPTGVKIDKAGKEDVEHAVAKMRSLKKEDGQPLAEETLRKAFVTLKLFYKHFLGEDEFYPKNVRWLKATANRDSKIKPSDLISEEEFTKLIAATRNVMFRAILACFYESALRPFELLSLKRKDLNLDETPAHITVYGKGDFNRTIPLIKCVPYLSAYLNTVKLGPDDPLFIEWYGYSPSTGKKPLEYAALNRALKRIAKDAGINHRRVWLYALRHSSITNMAAAGLGDQVLKKVAGWKQSAMLERYSHLHMGHVDKAMMEMNGIEVPERKESKTKPRVCPRCNYINDANMTFCGRCGSALDMATALNELGLQKMAIKSAVDPDYLAQLVDAAVEERLKKK